MNTEPARLIAGAAAILIILVNMAAYFLPQLDGDTAVVITGAISAIVAVLVGEGIRPNVTPWNADNKKAVYPEDDTGRNIQ